MKIKAPDPQPRDDGDYHVYVNDTAYGKPYGKIYLSSDDRALALDDITLADARRLAAAATRVERELSAAHARMAAPHGAGNVYEGTCQLCGKPGDDELHADAQDEDEDDGGCVAPSPAGSACLRPAGHDLIGGTPHRDLNRRHWDDDGWLTAEGEDEPKCARPGCGHPRFHHWEFGPTRPDAPASGCDLTSCLCAAYAAAVVTADEIRDLRQAAAPETEDAR